MKTTHYLTALLGALILSCAPSAEAVLITPTTGVLNDTRWEGNDNSNLSADEIEDIVDTNLELSVLYTANPGAPDSQSFASSYNTTFANTPSDPEDALIEYISGLSISGYAELYLYVKDGNQTPAFYIFDISSWNGTDDLDLQNFWPAQGAISHVSILGGGTASVPDGGITLVLLGASLAGMGVLRRYISI